MAKLGESDYLVRLIESLLCNKADDGPKEYIVVADVPQGSGLALLLWKSCICNIKFLAFACQRTLFVFEYDLTSGLLREGKEKWENQQFSRSS